MWTENPHRVQQLLADSGLETTSRWHRAQLALCEAEPNLFVNSFQDGQVRYAAPIQILIDGFSIGGTVAESARQEAMSW